MRFIDRHSNDVYILKRNGKYQVKSIDSIAEILHEGTLKSAKEYVKTNKLTLIKL